MANMEADPDIDTEENTLMYPKIERIYSDVHIKTEPIDVDDDYNSIEIAENSSEYYMPIQNKIILGSKPSSLPRPEPVAGPSSAPDTWEDQNIFECVECNLVYATRNELDSHKMASHSFLVARPMSRAIKTEKRISVSSTSSRSYLEDQDVPVRRQKAVKSTAKSALNKTFPVLRNALVNIPYGDIDPVPLTEVKKIDQDDRLLCKHCGIRFPDEIALIKHTYELLPENRFEEPQIKAQSVQNDVSDHNPSSRSLMQCLYCTCYFSSQKFLKRHFLKKHRATDLAVRQVKYSGKCEICLRTYANYIRHNNHLAKCHRKLLTSKTLFQGIAEASKLKCLFCDQIFHSQYALNKHKAEKHPGFAQKHTFLKVSDKPAKPLLAGQKILPLPLKTKLQTYKNILNSSYIPKQNLFKCNKCQIHFVSCSSAFAHSKRCSLAKGDWKCDKCRRSFTKAEKLVHTQQHQYSEKFKVHTVCDKIVSKVLYRCPKCELHFDEDAFGAHVSEKCVTENGVDCKSCDLKIHSDSFAKHRRYHMKYNFSSDDFILIEFVDASFHETVRSQVKKKTYKQKLVYCTVCTCYFYKPKNFHLESKCVELKRRLCTICGLTFSLKPYITHEKYDHGKLKLKLEDIKFVRIQDFKLINPVMPDFYQCHVCKVKFLSVIARSHHNCSKQVFTKCSKCSFKFDSDTYKIHLSFHNYGQSKTVTDSSTPSVVLKFYSCVTCNYGFDSYDSVVEHCQKHYINSEYLQMKYCKLCKLQCGEGHAALHSKRVKFEIFKFDYEKLLSEDWLCGFESLEKDAVDDILSKSVYGALRNIHLELLVEGPPERTLYKCAKCELNFEQDNVLEHTTVSCSSAPRFDCNSCTATFKTRAAKTNHMNIHVIYGDDITFRELVFNYENDAELNNALKTGKKKESLKFRKCQQCKLLIKISDYETHISEHEERVESKQYTCRRDGQLITYKLFKPINAAQKLYTLYRCKTCKGCVRQRINLMRHRCLPSDRYEKCTKCSHNFLAWNIKRHVEEHSLVPKFTAKNICVQDFQVLNNNVKKRRRYSSDDDVSTSSRVNVTVSKTYETRKLEGRRYSNNLSEDSQDNIAGYASTETTNSYAKNNIKQDEKVEREDESEESKIKIQRIVTPKKKPTESMLDIDIWRKKKKNRVYQCEKCYLFFVTKQFLLEHLEDCDDSALPEIPLICDQCDVVFHPSLVAFHEKLHELVRENPFDNYFYVINISTNGVSTDDETRWLYKCKSCDTNYFHTRTLERHFCYNNYGDDNLKRCEECDLKFSLKDLACHSLAQHIRGKLSKDDLHIEITDKKIVNLGEINLKAFVKGQFVDKIGITKIYEVNENEKQSNDGEAHTNLAINIKPAALTIEDVDCLDSDKWNRSVDANISRSGEGNESVSKDLKEMSRQLKLEGSVPIDNRVYKCVECAVYYTNRRTLLLHIMIKKHKQYEYVTCNMCGLVFGSGSLKKHKKIQHGLLKLTKKDFIVTDVFGSCIVDEENDQSTKYAVSIETGDLPSTELEDKKQLEDEKQLEGKQLEDEKQLEDKKEVENDKDETTLVKDGHFKIRLYQCKDCRICVNKSERKLHVCYSDIQKKECIRCRLFFRHIDIVQHKRLHQKYSELSRKNLVVIPFGRRTDKEHKIFKCVSCSTHFVNFTALEYHLKAPNHQTKRDYCKYCGLFFGRYSLSRHIYIHHRLLNLTVEQFNIVYVSDKDTMSDTKGNEVMNLNNTSDTTVSELDPALKDKSLKKLFKCMDCDVYFLNRASYYHHIYKHRKLVATEYIDCNICDFQFLIESLGVHMKSHKDKSFSLDKLLIETYVPNSIDAPKIECYFAKDGLNSKLVSTTTPFDNDDEAVLTRTDEQLSIIDSTSDETPKAKADEIINTDVTPYPRDASGEEATLNPIVVLPKLDASNVDV